MEDYDEDLNENAWFLAFTQLHPKLFQQASNERWVICIPRMDSWRGGGDFPKGCDASSFQSHCIKFESEVAPPARKEDSELPQKQSVINKYVTYNGKVVLIDGSKIVCSAGFVERATSFDSRSEHLELPADGVNHYARVLFEETYYNDQDQSYKVLCISRPLELPLAAEESIEGEGSLSPKSGDFQFSDAKLQGYHLWSRASNRDKLKSAIDARITTFIKRHAQGKFGNTPQPSPTEGSEMMQLDEMGQIRTCLVSVQDLFEQCVQIVLKDSKIKKETDLDSTLNATKCAVEGYVLPEIYGCVLRQISGFVAKKEASFNKITRNLNNIQPSDMDIEEHYWLSLPKAKWKLSRINKYCTPHDKLSCLQETIYCLMSKRDDIAAIGSDDLLPILIYLVVKSNVPNWITNLSYIQFFRLMPISKEQYEFYLATLEAAIEHIKQQPQQVKHKPVNPVEHTEMSALDEYFLDAQMGNVARLKETLSESAMALKAREQQMCHPLCACEKCSEFKRRTRSKSSEVLISVKTRNEKGQTALHVAAGSGQHEVVDLLISCGAELNAIDYHNSSPLHIAAQSGAQSVVFLLLHFGANANAVDNNANTPLHLCCKTGHEACVKAFLYFDPTFSVVDVNAVNDGGDTPLHIASRWGYEGIVSALMECGSNPKALNRRRQSAYDVSHNTRVSNAIKTAANQVVKIVRTFKHLQPNKENETKEKDRKTPEKKQRVRSTSAKELQETLDNSYCLKQIEKLLRAVADNDVNMVKFLCGWQSGEDAIPVDVEDDVCHPLCQCTKCQPSSHEHVLHSNSCNQERYTGLMIAAEHGFLDMAKLFLEHNASVNAKTKRDNYSALHIACKRGYAEIAKLLLSQDGANADIRDGTGSTPLYHSAIYNFPDCVQALLEGGASVNIRNHNGDTPLHAAVRWKNNDIVKLLLDQGALIYYKNNDGLTPVEFAEEGSDVRGILLSTVSPHCNTITSSSPHSATLLSATILEESGSPRVKSVTDDDEDIADTLYDKFCDPAPPTPPPVDRNVNFGIEGKAVDSLSADDDTPIVQNYVQSHRRQVSNGSSQDDATSDIFRDLSELIPKVLEDVEEEPTSCKLEIGTEESKKLMNCNTQEINLNENELDDHLRASQSSANLSTENIPTSEKYFEIG